MQRNDLCNDSDISLSWTNLSSAHNTRCLSASKLPAITTVVRKERGGGGGGKGAAEGIRGEGGEGRGGEDPGGRPASPRLDGHVLQIYHFVFPSSAKRRCGERTEGRLGRGGGGGEDARAQPPSGSVGERGGGAALRKWLILSRISAVAVPSLLVCVRA